MSKRSDDWFTCPVCGEAVNDDAPACPHCGSDEETGWAEDADYHGLDLPDGYDPDPPEPGKAPHMTIIVVLLIMGLLLLISLGSM